MDEYVDSKKNKLTWGGRDRHLLIEIYTHAGDERNPSIESLEKKSTFSSLLHLLSKLISSGGAYWTVLRIVALLAHKHNITWTARKDKRIQPKDNRKRKTTKKYIYISLTTL